MPKNIIIVDDEPDVRTIVDLALKNAGYATHQAEDGQRGYEMISKLKPDLVVLDVKMPRMNGYELLVKLRAEKAFEVLPVLMLTSLTAGSSKTDDQWGQAVGATAFLGKPFDTGKLVEKVREILGE